MEMMGRDDFNEFIGKRRKWVGSVGLYPVDKYW